MRPDEAEKVWSFHIGIQEEWGVWETSFSPDGSGHNSPNW